MLKIEKIVLDDKKVSGLWFLNTLNQWHEVEDYFELPKDVQISKFEIEHQLQDTYLKLTCSDDYYFKVPEFKGERIQFLSSIGGENPDRSIVTYHNKPQELYINLLSGLVDMNKTTILIKKIYVELIKNSQDNAEKHGLVLTLNYERKNNSGTEYIIYPEVAHHDLGQSNILYNSIDLTFFALLFWSIWTWFTKGPWSIGYIEYAIIFSYISQLLFRTYYLESTWLYFVINVLKWIRGKLIKKQKYKFPLDRFSKRAFRKEIYKQYVKQKKDKIPFVKL